MEFQRFFVVIFVFQFIGCPTLKTDILEILVGIQLAVIRECIRIDERKTV